MIEALPRVVAEAPDRPEGVGPDHPIRQLTHDVAFVPGTWTAERGVLAPNGALVWVSSLGDRTPIHLSEEDVAQALPGDWSGRASEAGWGSWCVLSRDS